MKSLALIALGMAIAVTVLITGAAVYNGNHSTALQTVPAPTSPTVSTRRTAKPKPKPVEHVIAPEATDDDVDGNPYVEAKWDKDALGPYEVEIREHELEALGPAEVERRRVISNHLLSMPIKRFVCSDEDLLETGKMTKMMGDVQYTLDPQVFDSVVAGFKASYAKCGVQLQ